MAVSPLLQLPETSTTQVQWDQPINDSLGYLECATQDTLNVDFATGDVTLTVTEQIRQFFFVAKNVSALRTLTLQDEINVTQPTRRFLSIHNDAANTADLTIKVLNNNTFSYTLPVNSSVLLYIRGNIVYVLGSYGVTATSPSLTYDISIFISGKPPANVEGYRLAVTQDLRIETNMSGSRAAARINPTTSAVFNVEKNGTNVGNVQLNPSGSHTFTASSPILLAPSDVLTVKTPNPQDATLEDVSIVIYAVKQ